MKLKYNLLTLSLLGLFAACNPMDDINAELESEGATVTKEMGEYVLTASDYETIGKAALKDAGNKADSALANAVKSENALNEFATAEKYVPKVLASVFPSWGNKSTVGVTFNYHEQTSELVGQFASIDSYALTGADYKEIWGVDTYAFLTPAHAPEKVIPALLLDRRTDAKAGDYVVVDYNYDTKEPETIQGEDLFEEDFAGLEDEEEIALDGWKQVCVEGAGKWEANVYNGDGCAQLSAYNKTGKVETWLITPAVRITSGNAAFTFDIVYGHYNGDCFDVMVSDAYQGGDALDKADWTSIKSSFTLPTAEEADGKYSKEKNAGSCPLASYEGKNVYFAFVYKGEGPGVATTTVQLDNVKVTTTRQSEINDKPFSDLYAFDGAAWKAYTSSDVVLVTPADYDAMGNPGSHDNFSESDPAENYVPQLLEQKKPYAQTGDAVAVIYKYYANKVTSVTVSEYVFDAGWTVNNNIVVKEKQTFLHNGEGWLFDPSINVAMSEADYQYLLDWVTENKPAYLDSRGGTEYWFGGGTYYQNFNLTLVTRRANDPEGVMPEDDTEAEQYLVDKVAEGLGMVLSHNYPDADTQMNGVDLYYNVSCKVYSKTYYKYVFKYKSLGDGKFEYTGEPVISNW